MKLQKIEILKHELSKTCQIYLCFVFALPSRYSSCRMHTVSWYCIMSTLTFDPFWQVSTVGQMMCPWLPISDLLSIGSRPGRLRCGARISPQAETPPLGLLHKQHDSSRNAVTMVPVWGGSSSSLLKVKRRGELVKWTDPLFSTQQDRPKTDLAGCTRGKTCLTCFTSDLVFAARLTQLSHLHYGSQFGAFLGTWVDYSYNVTIFLY